jgi:hypothetical protein
MDESSKSNRNLPRQGQEFIGGRVLRFVWLVSLAILIPFLFWFGVRMGIAAAVGALLGALIAAVATGLIWKERPLVVAFLGVLVIAAVLVVVDSGYQPAILGWFAVFAINIGVGGIAVRFLIAILSKLTGHQSSGGQAPDSNRHV